MALSLGARTVANVPQVAANPPARPGTDSGYYRWYSEYCCNAPGSVAGLAYSCLMAMYDAHSPVTRLAKTTEAKANAAAIATFWSAMSHP